MVNTQKINITIPDNIARDLKTYIRKSKRSAFVAEAVQAKLIELQTKQLRRELIEGYQARQHENAKLTTDWNLTTPDGLDDE